METLAEKHNLVSETRFRLKSFLLICARSHRNLFSDVRRFSFSENLKNEKVIALSESELWNDSDNDQNRILTAGKIQNLRLAVKKINGLEVIAGKTFSFWKHIGNPGPGKGYVAGREIREGCIVPTIAGGLCQLSNALYDAALQAGFEITERHRHTRVIPGSLAEQDRDATVKWNYIDLRFRAGINFHIEAELSASKLTVRFRSAGALQSPVEIQQRTSLNHPVLNDCFSCGNYECARHPEKTILLSQTALTTFILDEKWNEHDEYIKAVSTADDYFILPLFRNRLFKTSRYRWTVKNDLKVRSLNFSAIKRALALRFAGKKNNFFQKSLVLDEQLAKAASRRIPFESRHVVVSQNLLPFLWKEGSLGGRTFDVLMNRLPLEKLHGRLDLAHRSYPESSTLNDFRAPESLVDLENSALTKARNIITPHEEIAGIFNNKSIRLPWSMTKKMTGNEPGEKILFPASGLARKGAFEIRRLAQELKLGLIITGERTEEENFWNGIPAEFRKENIFRDVRLVIYPAYVEHQPRILLKALSLGITVIASKACGIPEQENLILFKTGDYEMLREKVKLFLQLQPDQTSGNLQNG